MLRITVPDVVGSSEEDALAALDAEGLDGAIEVDESYDQEVDAGDVISTDPGAGSVVDHDADILVTVSLGREPIEVPDVVGKPSEEATELIDDAGGCRSSVTRRSPTRCPPAP